MRRVVAGMLAARPVVCQMICRLRQVLGDLRLTGILFDQECLEGSVTGSAGKL